MFLFNFVLNLRQKQLTIMKENYKKLIVFVSNPSDVEEYKEAVCSVVDEINQDFSDQYKVLLLVREYKKSVSPYIGDNAQSIINNEIDDYDIFIGIYGRRLGTPTGNYRPETGTEYESGSVEEFEIAIAKFNAGRPICISLYFKNSVEISTPDDLPQLQQLYDWRDSLINKHQFINKFQSIADFRTNVGRFIHSSVKKIQSNELENRNKLKNVNVVQKLIYENIDDYLPRTVLSYSDSISEISSFLSYQNSKDLIDILEDKNKIVLLADAGLGKSVELNRIASYYSDQDSKYYPVLISLNLYTNEKIEELLPECWAEVMYSLLLLFDGFDEIESDKKITAIKEIEKFSNKYSQCKIIVSCRTNFYVSENDTFSGTLKSFSTFILNPLSRKEIDKYVKRLLNKKSDSFYEIVSRNKTIELLEIPFYLTFLAQKYLSEKKLPTSRSDIFEELIRSRIQFDDEHFRTVNAINYGEEKNKVINCFKKLSIVMEILGRNYITIDEYECIISDSSTRNFLRHKGLWNCKNDKWQFEHNCFQEYLAAKVLYNNSLNIIKKTIAFSPDFNIIIPSWINTLSFLLNLYRKTDLKSWILEIQPELTIKFEKDKVSNSLRERIFIDIFNNYKRKKNWIDMEKFNFYELAQFGQSEKTITFLLNNIRLDEHNTIIGNALNLLCQMEIPIEYRERVKQKLISIAIDYNKNYIQNDAIIALSMLKFDTEEVVEELFEEFKTSTDDWIRYGMYVLIENSDYLDEHIDYFLEGIQFYSGRYSNGQKDSRISNEFWHLESGLKKARTITAIIKILDHLIEKPTITHIIGFEKIIPDLMGNFSNAYLETNEIKIFERVCDLYLALHKGHLFAQAKDCLIFFDRTNTRIDAFRKLYKQKENYKPYAFFELLAYLSDEKCFDFIIGQYQDHNITNDNIWYFQNYLSGKLHDNFNKQINKVSDNKFILEPPRDFEKESHERMQHDKKVLFNVNGFLEELREIFKNEDVTKLNKELISEINYKRHDSKIVYSEIVLDKVNSILEGGSKSFEEIREIIEKTDWDEYSVWQIYTILQNNKDYEIDSDHLKKLEKWCLQKLSDIDFTKALIQNGNQTTTSTLAIWLHYFLIKYKFNYPPNVLLDMLSFDWYGQGIEYLEDFLPLEKITSRILKNLDTRKNNDYELSNYYNFCQRHKIKSAKNYLDKEILNISRNSEVRKQALNLLVDLGTNNQKLYNLLSKVKDPFKWEIVSRLVDRNSGKVQEWLLEQLRVANEHEKLEASSYLIKMQSWEGLEFYTEYLEREKKFYTHTYKTRSIAEIRSPESIKYLLRLLYLSYDKDLKEDKFNTLRRVVESIFTNIALISEQNFNRVRKAINEFINKYKDKIEDVNFLYAYLERLERQFYTSKSQKISLNEAIKKLENIEF